MNFNFAANICAVDKGQVRDEHGDCVCPPGTAKGDNDVCTLCRIESGMIINQDGYCVCALEKGFIIDEYGRCVCPVEHRYKLDEYGNCKPCMLIDCFVIRDLSMELDLIENVFKF